MRLNLYLLQPLLSRRNLLGLGLGVYWLILFVVSFRANSESVLGDREMMKLVGGQSGGAYCQQRTLCKDRSCQECTAAQLNGPCMDQQKPFIGQTGYYTETCLTNGNLETCQVTGQNTSAQCVDYFPCNCRPDENNDPKCFPGLVNNSQCTTIDAGVTCTYTPCRK